MDDEDEDVADDDVDEEEKDPVHAHHDDRSSSGVALAPLDEIVSTLKHNHMMMTRMPRIDIDNPHTHCHSDPPPHHHAASQQQLLSLSRTREPQDLPHFHSHSSAASHTHSSAARLYLAAIGLLCHLKRDQNTLRKNQNQKRRRVRGLLEHNNTTDDSDSPITTILSPHEEIPAIAAVLHDAQLFRVLLACLQPQPHPLLGSCKKRTTTTTTSTTEPTPSTTHHHHHHHNKVPKISSASSLSSSSSVSAVASSVISAAVSSVPRSPPPAVVSNHAAPMMMIASSSSSYGGLQSLPRFFVSPVLAARIFYAVLQYVDQWPAPLVYAYAQDCFGPRAWVDDIDVSYDDHDDHEEEKDCAACQGLVLNLALTHRHRRHKEEDAPLAQKGLDLPASSSSSSSSPLLEGEPQSQPMQQQQQQQHQQGMLTSARAVAAAYRNNADDADDVNVNVKGFHDHHPNHNKHVIQKPQTSVGGVSSSHDDSDGSSSGDEDEDVRIESVVSVQRSTKEEEEAQAKTIIDNNNDHVHLDESSRNRNHPHHGSYVYPMSHIRFHCQPRVRPRFLGDNLTLAHEMIAASLWHRLDVVDNSAASASSTTQKQPLSQSLSPPQNYTRLLQTLPAFVSVPAVREIIVTHPNHPLERWLQSPALAEMARKLWVQIVQHVETVDPPLEADVRVVLDGLMNMKVKASQLNAHIENITIAVKRIPSARVVHRLYATLIPNLQDPPYFWGNAHAHAHAIANSDPMRRKQLFAAIHHVVPPRISFAAMAATLRNYLRLRIRRMETEKRNFDDDDAQAAASADTENVRRMISCSDDDDEPQRTILRQRMKTTSTTTTIRCIVRSMADALSTSFNACALVEALVSCTTRNHDGRSGNDADDAAQRYTHDDDDDDDDDAEDIGRMMLHCVLMHASVIVTTCTSTTARSEKKKVEMLSLKKKKKKIEGLPEYSKDHLRSMLLSVRPMLLSWCCNVCGQHYASYPDKDCTTSEYPAGAGAPSFESALCITPNAAKANLPSKSWRNVMRCLLFLEDAESPILRQFLGFGSDFNDDSAAEWEAQQLVPYLNLCHEHGLDLNDDMIRTVVNACSDSRVKLSSQIAITLLEYLFKGCSIPSGGNLKVHDPALAWELFNLTRYDPCTGKSHDLSPLLPDEVKLALPGLWWRVTILVLIMCSKSMKRIGGLIWRQSPTVCALVKMIVSNRYRFPTIDCDDSAKEIMKKGEHTARDTEMKMAELLFLPPVKENEKVKEKTTEAFRISKRLLKQKEKKEASERLAAATAKRTFLKAACKSIMIWDPDGPARKPPKEVAELLVSVEKLFNLSDSFQQSVDPDFLLLTLGGTSRGAIERAYDWLIPVISKYPEIIGRLPSSASCFLLLRAYETDSDEHSQLQELATPLLRHVAECLNGKFEKLECVKAFDLIMSDFANRKAERRKCARRVLYDSFRLSGQSSKPCLTSILDVKFAPSLVIDGIKYISVAATFEQGSILKSLITALEAYFKFATLNGIESTLKFADILVELVSSRPSVFADVMSNFADVRALMINIVHSEFVAAIKSDHDVSVATELMVRLTLRKIYVPDKPFVYVRLPLLLSITIILSIWDSSDSNVLIDDLLDALMKNEASAKNETDSLGLASGTFVDSGEPALVVENWITLGKAPCDYVARRAALSAPINILPRLLLCTGLSRGAFEAMIDRLGRLGDSSGMEDEVYRQLLAPPPTSNDVDIASNDIDIDIDQSHDVDTRLLLGRLAAYVRLYGLKMTNESTSHVSTTFISWLANEWRDKESKSSYHSLKEMLKTSKMSSKAPPSSLSTSFSLLSLKFRKEETPELPGSDVCLCDFIEDQHRLHLPEISSQEDWSNFIQECFRNGELCALERWLYASSMVDGSIICSHLVQFFQKQENKIESVTRLILKWVPLLSRAQGSAELYQFLFLNEAERSMSGVLDDLVTRCSLSWTQGHVSNFIDWLVATNTSDSDSSSTFTPCGANRAFRLIMATSGAQSDNVAFFLDTDEASSTSLLACLPREATETLSALITTTISAMRPQHGDAELYSRNNLAPSVILLLSMAGTSRDLTQLFTRKLIKEINSQPKIPNNDTGRLALDTVLLRLYFHRPKWMNVDKLSVRTALLEAAESISSQQTLRWRSQLDDEIANMVDYLVSGDMLVTRRLADVSQLHPLLILRIIPDLIEILEDDASPGINHLGRLTKVQGRDVGEPKEADFRERTVQVKVCHWGYCYTEALWYALLEVITSMPQELMAGIGLKLGVLDFLVVFLKLFSVQQPLLITNRKTTRLWDKLKECLDVIQGSNRTGWRSWLVAAFEPGLEIRHVLMICKFITPQEAIQC